MTLPDVRHATAENAAKLRARWESVVVDRFRHALGVNWPKAAVR